MRHRVAGKKLGRTKNQRKALFKSLVEALVLNGQIKTTEAKAKAVRPLVEKLITKAKEATVSSRRQIAEVIHDKKILGKLVDEIAPGFANRQGGYTRILRLEKRRGDQAQIVKLELVEREVNKEKEKKEEK